MKFQKLTPVITDKDSYQSRIYREAFDFVFTNDELRNIAVSGAYGAGKSSVFESYMYHWKSKEKIIRISLAHFEQLETCGKGTKNQDEASLEAKIINQLIHQINPSKIKKTSFIAQIKGNLFLQVLDSLGISVAILIIIFLVFVEKFNPVFTNITIKPLQSFFKFLNSGDGLLLLSAILFLIVVIFILTIVQHSRGNILLKKLSVKDVAIDLSDENTESFFDKYLSEIRYLFESSGSTIVAIEDIDRYFSSSIFEKIRELNTVINYDMKKPVRFFYIIKDDIFTSKDRTKFFDFIIPVVPIIDASNSYSQLRYQLQEGVEGSSLDNVFLRGLSIYIDDMRVLKNIINEFLIYREELAKQELNPNKLLAIITYKNLFPKDFNDLQVGTGYLFSLIGSRDNFADYIINNEQEELEKLGQKIETLNREQLQDLDELGALFLQPTSSLATVSDQMIETYDSQVSLFTEIKRNPKKVVVWNGSQYLPKDLSSKISDLQKNVNYSKRKELIDLKLKQGIDSLENERLIIESHIQAVHESRLISNLLDSTNIDYFLNLPLINDPKKYIEITGDLHFRIIPFLIRSGMIDGNYKDYLTYFYDNELRIQDQRFIRSVFDEEPLTVTHKLTNPQAVLQVLESISNNNPAFLNIDLFFYIFDNAKDDDAIKFIKLSKRYKNYKLIIDYLHEGKQIALLIQTLNSIWDSFYIDSGGGSEWRDEDLHRFLQMELIHEKSEVLKTINNENNISADIESKNEVFAGLEEDKLGIVINNLIAIGVKLQDITALANTDTFSVNLLGSSTFITDIYKKHLYKITTPNIRYWLRLVYKIEGFIDDGELLSAVFSRPEEPLYKYISENLDEIVMNIISTCPAVKFKDNQITIQQILYSTKASLETKELYVKRLLSGVEDISNIQDVEVIKMLLKNNTVKLSTNNLLTLFVIFEKKFTKEFTEYLTKHELDRVKDKSINSAIYSNELVEEFFNSALNDSSLNKNITELLLSATRLKIVNQTAIVGSEKAGALVSSGVLVLNDANLAYIRMNHPELIMEFEKSNLEGFKEILDSEQNTDPQEIVDLLESDVNGQKQISLLSHVNVKIPYKATYRYPGVKQYIVKYLLDENDIEKLITDPMAQSENLISATKTALIVNLDFIIQNQLALPYALLMALKTTISHKNFIEVFANSMNLYTPKAIRENILDLHISPFDEMFNGKHPKFENNAINQRILSVLIKKKMATKSLLHERLYPRG